MFRHHGRQIERLALYDAASVHETQTRLQDGRGH